MISGHEKLQSDLTKHVETKKSSSKFMIRFNLICTYKIVRTKGQLISKCLSGVFNSSKNKLENSNFCPSLLYRNFLFGFWKN